MKEAGLSEAVSSRRTLQNELRGTLKPMNSYEL